MISLLDDFDVTRSILVYESNKKLNLSLPWWGLVFVNVG